MLDEYFKLQKEIFEHFGYVEDWAVIPMVDHREYYWNIDDESGGTIAYSEKPLTSEIVAEGKELYEASIYTQRFLPKWVYRAEEFTLVCMDTNCDGNKFLGVFANDKEMKEATTRYSDYEDYTLV